MSAPLGNQFWRLGDHPGRPRAYEPDALWEKAIEYFDWCSANPWYKKEALKGGEMAGTLMDIPTERPFTQTGFCVFAGISMNTFDVYSKTEDFQEVTTRIREIMYTQKFEGAAVGCFNANIIARDLGLADKVDQTQKHSGEVTFKGMNVIKPNEPGT